jgi:NTP pyrophosphatase (non-canonical NTP hydrolase)
MYAKLIAISKKLTSFFVEGDVPFQIATRLLEECGELAKEINHFEGAGIKLEKYGPPDKKKLVMETQHVMRTVLQIAIYYDLEKELEESINTSYEKIVLENSLEQVEQNKKTRISGRES